MPCWMRNPLAPVLTTTVVDVILAPIQAEATGSVGVSIKITSTTVVVYTGSGGIAVVNPSGGSATFIAAGKWAFQVKAYA